MSNTAGCRCNAVRIAVVVLDRQKKNVVRSAVKWVWCYPNNSASSIPHKQWYTGWWSC
jgi:hypothetical protein